MAKASQDNNSGHAIVLAVVNFVYLMLSVMLLAPNTYQLDSGPFGNGYGSGSVVYSLGVLYAFFEKALSASGSLDTVRKRAVSILGVILATLHIASVVLYYFVWPVPEAIIAGYLCIVATAGLALFQVVSSAIRFIIRD